MLLLDQHSHGVAAMALPRALLVGLTSNIPFAILIELGQDCLPSRPGVTASHAASR